MQGVNICYILHIFRIEYHLLIGMTQSTAILSRIASELTIMRMNQNTSECIEMILYTITISVAVLKPFSFITFRYYHKTSKSRLRRKTKKARIVWKKSFCCCFRCYSRQLHKTLKSTVIVSTNICSVAMEKIYKDKKSDSNDQIQL